MSKKNSGAPRKARPFPASPAKRERDKCTVDAFEAMVLLQELEESGYIEFCGGSIDSGVKAERDLLVAEGETVDQHNVQFWALFLMGELGGRLLKPCPVEWLVQ